MNPFLRLLACAATICIFNVDHAARAEVMSGLQISNPLAQRIIKRLSGKTQFGAWTVDVADSQKNYYAIAATMSLPDSDTNMRALLSVACIKKMPSVSLIFDGDRQQFSVPMPVLIVADNGAPQREMARAMTGRDAVGLFEIRAFLTVQFIRNASELTVSLPQMGKIWHFSLSGLAETIMYMKSPCYFSAQNLISESELTLLQIHLNLLGYNIPTDGEIGARMEEAILHLQKKYGLEETGQIDDPTYDLILRTTPH